MQSYTNTLNTPPEHKAKSARVLTLFILLSLILILPSGSAGTINIKAIIIGLLAAPLILWVITFRRIPAWLVNLFLSSIVFMAGYTSLSIINGFGSQAIASAIKAWATTLAIPSIIIASIGLGIISLREALVAFLYSTSAYSITKITIFALGAAGLIDITSLFEGLYNIFGYSPITYNYGWFTRINTPADFALIPATLLIHLTHKNTRRHKPIPNILNLLFLTAIIISFSRYLWALYTLTLASSWVINSNLKITISSIIKFFLIMTTLVAITATAGDWVIEFIFDRYFGVYAQSSDSIRHILLPALWEMFTLSPLYGHGIGAHLEHLIYFDDAPWNYVLQWLSFLAQFGIMGVAAILIALSLPLWPLFKKTNKIHHPKKIILALSTVYIAWLSTGLFNTFLLSSSAGVVYLGFALTSFLIKKKQNQHENHRILSPAVSPYH